MLKPARFGCFATTATRSQRWTSMWLGTSAATATRTTPARHRALWIRQETAHRLQTRPTTTCRAFLVPAYTWHKKATQEPYDRRKEHCFAERDPAKCQDPPSRLALILSRFNSFLESTAVVDSQLPHCCPVLPRRTAWPSPERRHCISTSAVGEVEPSMLWICLIYCL